MAPSKGPALTGEQADQVSDQQRSKPWFALKWSINLGTDCALHDIIHLEFLKVQLIVGEVEV